MADKVDFNLFVKNRKKLKKKKKYPADKSQKADFVTIIFILL